MGNLGQKRSEARGQKGPVGNLGQRRSEARGQERRCKGQERHWGILG